MYSEAQNNAIMQSLLNNHEACAVAPLQLLCHLSNTLSFDKSRLCVQKKDDRVKLNV